MAKVLVVDDERRARETIVQVLEMYCPQVAQIEEADGVQSAVDAIQRFRPDLVLLDIHLTDGSGFEVISRLSSIPLNVIFITAYEEYAIKAFRVAALDYILKPIDADEFALTIEKGLRTVEQRRFQDQMEVLMNVMKGTDKQDKKITLKTAESIHIVAVSDIVFCLADKNYTTFAMVDKSKIIVSKSIGEYEELLSRDGFMRIHQSYLINLKHMVRYEKGDGGFVVTSTGESLPVATRKKDQLMTYLQSL